MDFTSTPPGDQGQQECSFEGQGLTLTLPNGSNGVSWKTRRTNDKLYSGTVLLVRGFSAKKCLIIAEKLLFWPMFSPFTSMVVEIEDQYTAIVSDRTVFRKRTNFTNWTAVTWSGLIFLPSHQSIDTNMFVSKDGLC